MLSDKDKEMLNLLGIRAGIVAENPKGDRLNSSDKIPVTPF